MMTELSFPQASRLTPWSSWQQGVRATLLLAAREARLAWRTPAYLIPNMLVPIFFYFIMVGSLDAFADTFGITNWKAFQLPVGILFAVQGWPEHGRRHRKRLLR